MKTPSDYASLPGLTRDIIRQMFEVPAEILGREEAPVPYVPKEDTGPPTDTSVNTPEIAADELLWHRGHPDVWLYGRKLRIVSVGSHEHAGKNELLYMAFTDIDTGQVIRIRGSFSLSITMEVGDDDADSDSGV